MDHGSGFRSLTIPRYLADPTAADSEFLVFLLALVVLLRFPLRVALGARTLGDELAAGVRRGGAGCQGFYGVLFRRRNPAPIEAAGIEPASLLWSYLTDGDPIPTLILISAVPAVG